MVVLILVEALIVALDGSPGAAPRAAQIAARAEHMAAVLVQALVGSVFFEAPAEGREGVVVELLIEVLKVSVNEVLVEDLCIPPDMFSAVPVEILVEALVEGVEVVAEVPRLTLLVVLLSLLMAALNGALNLPHHKPLTPALVSALVRIVVFEALVGILNKKTLVRAQIKFEAGT